MTIIIKSGISATVRQLDSEGIIKSVDKGVAYALEQKVLKILLEAIERAKANRRKTLQVGDL